MRFKIRLSYDGSSYLGSQSQTTSQNTIMGAFYIALENLQIKDSKITASGRTDKGVHAFNQVFHIDVPSFWNSETKLQMALNHQLPDTIHVKHVQRVDDNFHARYSTKKRAYRYILSDNVPNPFESKYVTYSTHPLNITLLKEAIAIFEGEHNFEMFKKSGSEVKNFQRIMYKTGIYTYRRKTILYFEANGFLYSQIRLMVGFLLKINEGKLTCKELKEQLTCKKMYNTRPAPANGLYLAKIFY